MGEHLMKLQDIMEKRVARKMADEAALLAGCTPQERMWYETGKVAGQAIVSALAEDMAMAGAFTACCDHDKTAG